MLKLKLQYFGHLMRRVDSLEKTLMLGGIGGGEGDDRGWDGWMASPTRWTWVWVNSRSWWWTGRPGMLWFMGSQRVGHNWETELNWTEVGKRKLHNQANIMGTNLSLLNLFSLNQLNSDSKTSSFPQNPFWTLLGPSPWCRKLSFFVLWCQIESLKQSLGWSRQRFFCWLWWLLHFF